jgi:hypothetical protein
VGNLSFETKVGKMQYKWGGLLKRQGHWLDIFKNICQRELLLWYHIGK